MPWQIVGCVYVPNRLTYQEPNTEKLFSAANSLVRCLCIMQIHCPLFQNLSVACLCAIVLTLLPSKSNFVAPMPLVFPVVSFCLELSCQFAESRSRKLHWSYIRSPIRLLTFILVNFFRSLHFFSIGRAAIKEGELFGQNDMRFTWRFDRTFFSFAS